MFTGNFWLWFWGIVISAFGWAYYHYLGEYAPLMQTIILCIWLGHTSFENSRLRKQLKELQPKNTSKPALWLLFWAIVYSALAWAYYHHYLGEYTALLQTIILGILLVQTSFETSRLNSRLRKQLEELQPKNTHKPESEQTPQIEP